MRATTFSEFLRFYRRRAALTQEELAARTGLGVRTLSDLERGRVHTPQAQTVDLLVAGLALTDVEADEFVGLARASEVEQHGPFTQHRPVEPQTVGGVGRHLGVRHAQRPEQPGDRARRAAVAPLHGR
ncbi:hypothetical protein GCM10011609_83810 [Lentzea pudingi]|uniref:HTH cro/C1-type domain-containing protein n=1 Tax=Lentzea pudingi TaxID=1789439 RepID=A0ABQ2IU08_9PSEU|nr:helix-turn-helix domain-containing protein [Lentzea pudingi]GGN28032.1 hypothetical protein GCM10011609_83810 [Lentzea pudingi]